MRKAAHQNASYDMIRTTLLPFVRRHRVILDFAITLLAIGLFEPRHASAETASYAEMRRVCENWLSQHVRETGLWAGSANPEINSVAEITVAGQVLALCYSIAPGGYVVVPVLKELPPVKLFSEDNSLEMDKKHSLGALVRDVLVDRTKKYVEIYGSLHASQGERDEVLFDRCNRRAWEIYLKSKTEFNSYLNSREQSNREQVGPLLTTDWHQLAPYNNFCPMGDGGRCVAWCVAIALAQILWYHQWPPAGFGNTSYLWDGDQSCGGSTPGRLLSANFSDRYGWSGTTDEVAEICFEVGMAYNVDYGACYSIGYVSPIFDFLPENFAYQNTVEEEHRDQHSGPEWFAVIQEEINQDRPIQYLIYNHMIVADGWMTLDSQYFYHMVYGWDDWHTTWYALDNIYCGWPGCDPMVERMFTKIYPDREIMFNGDTIAGYIPLEINFTASSDRQVENWTWDFGDGDSAFTQTPTHVYTSPGIFDVSLTIEFSDSSRTRIRSEHIYALADTLTVGHYEAVPGSTVEVTISTRNAIPLAHAVIPIEYNGDLELFYDSCSVVGCRTESFQSVSEIDVDSVNSCLAILMQAWVSGYSEYPYLEAGSGQILKLFFTVSPTAAYGQQASISCDGYDGYDLLFAGSIYGQEHDYQPVTVLGLVEIPYICGDVDGSGGNPNVADVTYLVDYLFFDGPPPPVPEAANVDGEGGVNVADVTYLVDYLFFEGPDPICGPIE